jgi:putative OPT family oligopeptide transporter
MTVKAVALGLFLAFVFGAANAYIGMRAGQTVAATIPAAVIAVAVFRLPSFRGTILEQNIVRTAASVGEALVAGAIFTIPAFVLVEIDGVRLWSDLRAHYWDATWILLTGGLIGILFIVILRRPLCVDAGLPWPESVASVEIVKSGAEKGGAARTIFGAMGFGALLNILKTDKGLQIFREYSEGFWNFPQSVIRHLGADVTYRGGIPWSTPALSPALIGIGYIIGPRYASVNVAGGIIAWWMLIPLLLFFDPDLPQRIGGGQAAGYDAAAIAVWRGIVRPIAVGAMLVAAANTMFGMRDSLVKSLRGAFSATGASAKAAESVDRTERDIPTKWVILGSVALLIPITFIYRHFTGDWSASLVAALLMTVTGFLLSAVGGYLVGLVGSSNQPVSGLTLAALVLSALVLLAAGISGKPGIAAVLGVASVVCGACCVSGSLIQDLKAGHLLGGTPWKMQVVEIIAVVMLSFFLMAPILTLHEANLDTGGIGGRALPAPQAGLMAQLAKGIMGGQMAWGLLAIGAGFGIALLLCGARAPMLVAVGMYLPFDTSAAIFLGGVLQWLVTRRMRNAGDPAKAQAEEKGTLIASGLIAGEAIMGILLAVTFVAGVPSFTRLITGQPEFGFFQEWGGRLSLIAFAAIAWVLVRLPTRTAS